MLAGPRFLEREAYRFLKVRDERHPQGGGYILHTASTLHDYVGHHGN